MSTCDSISEPCTKKARVESSGSGFSFNFDLGLDADVGSVVEQTPLEAITAPLPHSYGQLLRDVSGLGGLQGRRGDVLFIHWLQSDHYTMNVSKVDRHTFEVISEAGNVPRDSMRLLLASESTKEQPYIVEYDTVFHEDNKLPSPFNIEAGLSTLVWPYSKDQFLTSIFQKRCLVVHATGSRQEQQKEDFDQFHIDKLISNSTKSIIWMRTKLGAMQYIDASPEVAMSGYLAGNTLYFNPNYELQKKYVKSLCLDLNCNFGVERESQGVGGDLEIFAVNTTSSPTGWHFDAQENFSVQLVGLKRWSIVPGDKCVLSNLHAGSTNRPSVQGDIKVHTSYGVAPISQLTSKGRLVAQNLDTHEQKQSFVVRPGTVFYHPAGVWHKVETLDDGGSLSINFSLDSMRWSELVMSRITQLVQASDLGRQRVQFKTREEALSQVDNLLEKIKHMLGEITSKDIVPPVLDLQLRGDVDNMVGNTEFMNNEHGIHRFRDSSKLTDEVVEFTRNPLGILCRSEPFFATPPATQSNNVIGSIVEKEHLYGDLRKVTFSQLPTLIQTTKWVAYSVHHGIGQEGYTSQHSCVVLVDIEEDKFSNDVPFEFAAMFALEEIMEMQFSQVQSMKIATLCDRIAVRLELSSMKDKDIVPNIVSRVLSVLTHVGVLRE